MIFIIHRKYSVCNSKNPKKVLICSCYTNGILDPSIDAFQFFDDWLEKNCMVSLFQLYLYFVQGIMLEFYTCVQSFGQAVFFCH